MKTDARGDADGEDGMTETYAQALAEHGIEDVQPLYRQLLLRLKTRDGEAYERAVARYRSEVEGVAGGDDTLAAWLSYGAWLASRLEPGNLFTISEEGLAARAPDPFPSGPMLIHLPDAANRKGFVIAMPATPSEAQRATADLLCE
ncbi:hypothetical protein [Candidatus Palauibacter polyketidifaciens]|uniref:hypothetical protein n=1 Tax=Candidatus Palauibacter polyketidifaciens TaxID=3056740 RepID=UPI00139E93AD|nr:hypothetical protein [Candidatus Palauibacter polyketidifaciens]MDE2720323.1 hypothetical protein [Candidatus Palauibacter polyketidifaciens]MYE35541.1 hypothetical protein [Gemmatimonadales bacterium]